MPVDKRKCLTEICRKLGYAELQTTIDRLPDAELNTAVPYVVTAISETLSLQAKLMDQLGMPKEAAQMRHEAAQARKNGYKKAQ
jgi:hypothetical protein